MWNLEEMQIQQQEIIEELCRIKSELSDLSDSSDLSDLSGGIDIVTVVKKGEELFGGCACLHLRYDVGHGAVIIEYKRGALHFAFIFYAGEFGEGEVGVGYQREG